MGTLGENWTYIKFSPPPPPPSACEGSHAERERGLVLNFKAKSRLCFRQPSLRLLTTGLQHPSSSLTDALTHPYNQCALTYTTKGWRPVPRSLAIPWNHGAVLWANGSEDLLAFTVHGNSRDDFKIVTPVGCSYQRAIRRHHNSPTIPMRLLWGGLRSKYS